MLGTALFQVATFLQSKITSSQEESKLKYPELGVSAVLLSDIDLVFSEN